MAIDRRANFTESGAKRIVTAVRAVEGAPTDLTGVRRQRLQAALRPMKFAKVVTEYNDYLAVHSWDGTTEGTALINVAKPWKLRHDYTHYAGLTSLTTVSASEVTVTDGTTTETWKMTPSYQAGDVIAYWNIGKTGVMVSSVELTLVDVNLDGRAWAVQ